MNENVFSRFTNWLIDVETDFVRLVTTLLPWAVPLVPAYIVFEHAINQMEYAPWIAWVMGVVTEGLGLASLVTSFRFWSHNRRYTDKKNQYPLIVPVSTYLFYLAVVMTINVVLDWKSGIEVTKILVVALFSLLSLPAGLLLSVQTIFSEDEKDRRIAKDERKKNIQADKEAKLELERLKLEQQLEQEKEAQLHENVMERVKDFLIVQNISPTQVGVNGVITPKLLAEAIGIEGDSGPVRTALSRLRSERFEPNMVEYNINEETE